MIYKGNGSRDDADGSKISFHAWKILAILSVIATMVLYAETMLVPAIPRLINDFGITYSISSWILSSCLSSCKASVVKFVPLGAYPEGSEQVISALNYCGALG